ncbi:MAG: peptide-methionine (S)-S-oxide reductase MsrA, partial [Bacteroidota bacterium]
MASKKKLAVTTAIATFACGCFWSKEYWWQQLEGVQSTLVGFTGGHVAHPNYKLVCRKQTGHAEAVKLQYNPSKIRFEDLARYFFNMHDPTIDRSGNGGQYRSAIFYHTPTQHIVAKQLIAQLKSDGYDVKTRLEAATIFYTASARHQKYCSSRKMIPR